jgi:hypothetical protein
MSYLLYSSDEMFSATELLRKSKSIFEKITNKVITKAIILRDGKPAFILFNFKEYENIMSDYEKYKSFYNTYNSTNKNNEKVSISVDEKVKNDNGSKQKIDDFEVNISTQSIDDIPHGEIKEFWNK